MLNSLNTGVGGMQRAQDRINLIGDNVANVNTTGFKATRMTFEDSFSQTLLAAVAGGSAGGGSPGVQIGTGVSTAATSCLFTQGQMSQTGVSTDLYIAGDGFFIVKDVDGTEYATRAGDFHVDTATSYLVTNNGQRVQGYADGALTTRGDIKIDAEGKSSGAVSRINVQQNGEIFVTLADGTTFRRGQVLLESFRSPQALAKAGSNLYGGLDAAGRLGAAAPKSAGLGSLEAGALELSNVDLANEFANLISTQRSFQANARIVTTSDEMLLEMVNLKR